jgi:hypothetical protein
LTLLSGKSDPETLTVQLRSILLAAREMKEAAEAAFGPVSDGK